MARMYRSPSRASCTALSLRKTRTSQAFRCVRQTWYGRFSRLSSPDSRIKGWRSRYRTELRADTFTTSVDVRFASRRNLSAKNDGAKPTLTTAGNPGKRTRPGTPRRTVSGGKQTPTIADVTTRPTRRRRPKMCGVGGKRTPTKSPISALAETIGGGRSTVRRSSKMCHGWKSSSAMTGSAKSQGVSIRECQPAIRYSPALITSFRWRAAAHMNGRTW